MRQGTRRNRVILGLLSLGLLAGAALTAGHAQAVDAVGPYYAEPAWDQKKAAANRFVVLTNWFSEAVLDKETGLVWERHVASDERFWGAGSDNARLACASRTVGGRKGWRLPSIAELASLSDLTGPLGLPTGSPFQLGFSRGPIYWSATTDAADSNRAWYMSLQDGQVNTAIKTVTLLVWCVRGGGPLSEY